ncbi:MAG: NADPH-dependent FMN reductase [Tepidisphaeraceae bacterium]
MGSGPILVISGTNRPGANALKVAKIVEAHHRRAGTPVELLGLAELTPEVFDPIAYATKPPKMQELQQRVLDSRGLHVITPEYNGSFPGVLKYFIDMLKFPESFENKPVAFVGEAAGMWGGLRSVEQLQAIFAYRNAHLFHQRVFMPNIKNALDADGKLVDPALDERLMKQAVGFAEYVRHFMPRSA